MHLLGPVEMLFDLLFSVVRPPNLKLKAPKVQAPGRGVVMYGAMLMYFLVTSGVVYDVVAQPAGMGETEDPATGVRRTLAFLPYRVNGQYIIEGLSAGFLFMLGGLGFVLLEGATDVNQTKRWRGLQLGAGALAAVVACTVSILFLRIKVPGYLT